MASPTSFASRRLIAIVGAWALFQMSALPAEDLASLCFREEATTCIPEPTAVA